MKKFNEEIKAYVSENGFKEESGFDKYTYSVIYENGWYWNGITLTQSEYLFDKKPIISIMFLTPNSSVFVQQITEYAFSPINSTSVASSGISTAMCLSVRCIIIYSLEPSVNPKI